MRVRSSGCRSIGKKIQYCKISLYDGGQHDVFTRNSLQLGRQSTARDFLLCVLLRSAQWKLSDKRLFVSQISVCCQCYWAILPIEQFPGNRVTQFTFGTLSL